MQLIGSIFVAFAIVAVTIAVVTGQLGPYGEDEDRARDRQEQIEEQREERQDQQEDNSGSGNDEDR
jgi:hypothetical protein